MQASIFHMQPKISSKEVMVQLGMALLFFLLAQLSLSLGVTAFLTRPLWLPAALLAACVISRGTRDVTGLALGAAAFGYFLYRTRQHAFPVACINMLAVFVQIIVANWAMRQFMSSRARELWQGRDLLLSAIIFGPLMMALKPAIIFPMLIWLNLIPTDNWLDRATDWMASDILAAYLAGPMLLVFFGQPREWWLSRRTALLYGQLLIVIGFVSAMQTTAKIEGDRVQDRVKAELASRAERLQGQLQQLTETSDSSAHLSVSAQRSLPLIRLEHESPPSADAHIVDLPNLQGWGLDLRAWLESERHHFRDKNWKVELTPEPQAIPGSVLQIDHELVIGQHRDYLSVGLTALQVRGMVSGTLWSLQLSFALAAMLGTVVSLLLSARQRQMEDLVEQRTASLRLTSNELRLFKALADQSTDPIVVAQPRINEQKLPTLTYVNPAFLRVTQLSEDEAKSLGVVAIRGPNTDPNRMVKLMEQLLAGKSVSDEFFHYRKDGSAYIAQLTAFPIFTEGGEVTHWAGLYRDISVERERQAREREQQRDDQDRERHEQIGRMAGGVAHDFNNLLTAVQGSVELIRMEHGESVAPDLLESIEQAVVTGSSLTQQLLAFSGRGRGRVEDIALDERLRAMQKMLAIAVSQQAKLSIQIEPGHYLARIDSAAWVQVVMNLVVNASQSLRGEAGRIGVSLKPSMITAPSENVQLKGSQAKAGPHCELIVQDTGCGIADALINRIFEPFFSTKDHGSGLGLAAVAAAVEQFSGWVEIQSAPAQGTSFHVWIPTIPARPNHASAPPISASGQIGGEHRKRVLVVDDEPGVRAYAASVLEGAGYASFQAADGIEAQEMLSRMAFDAVLTDLTMPRASGAELIERIAAENWTRNVVVMTGFSTDRSALIDRHSGLIKHWLEKPFSASALVNGVALAVDVRDGQRPT